MGNSRKPREPQGIYAFPADARRAVDAMLAENLPYAVITQKVAERFGLKTSPAALSGYFGKGFNRDVVAEDRPEGHVTENLSGGPVTISITVPAGCTIQVSMAGASPTVKME